MQKRGSALITALFIMTIITIVVTSMSSKLRLDIHHAHITINTEKLFLASEAVTFWAIEELRKEHKPYKALDKKGKVLNFPGNSRDLYPNVEISGAVYDLQALFNINNLSDNIYKPIFFTLIHKIDENIKKQQIMYIVSACSNWVNGTSTAKTGHDTWLDRYLKLNPAYLPAYQAMQSISELRTVYGITPQIYNNLQPYLSALPESTKLNINTVRKEILTSLARKSKSKLIKNILKTRSAKPIENLSEIAKVLETAKISQDHLTTESTYYLVVAKTKTTNLNFTNYVILKVIENHDKTRRVDIIKQSFNTL